MFDLIGKIVVAAIVASIPVEAKAARAADGWIYTSFCAIRCEEATEDSAWAAHPAVEHLDRWRAKPVLLSCLCSPHKIEENPHGDRAYVGPCRFGAAILNVIEACYPGCVYEVNDGPADVTVPARLTKRPSLRAVHAGRVVALVQRLRHEGEAA